MLIIAFERIVIYHQRQHFNAPGFPKPHTGIIFPEIKRRDADKNIKNCCKFFANYFFYKYGLEICYIMSAITISVRLDVYSLIYAIFLGISLLLSRRGNARIWPLYTIILAVLLPVQFLLRLGFPLGLCLEYPWDGHSYVDRNLEKWLFLPDYEYPQNAFKFVADFFQLLFVCLQWQVFRKEKSDNMENYGGGDNQDILPEVEGNTPIPVEDFTSSIDSYLDVIKFAIFVYLFWVTLFIVFITGTARINIFSMGYVIAVFCFMWYGQEFILLPLRKIRRRWCMLIGYTYFVLLLKAALQLLGCVYIDYLYKNQCWLIQLLGLTCLNPSNEYLPGQGVKHCEVERDNTGLMWDVICFTFLLLQLRIYNSQYFRHVVASAEAQSRLASRGAELINSILIKDVLKQKEDEKIVLYNIKKKMEVLKKKQAHKKEDFIEPDEHFQAIRSGDYFLFDDDSDKEEGPDTLTLGQDDEDAKGKADPLKLITTALDSGTKAAVDKADDIEEKKSLDKVDIQKEKKSASSDTESEEEEEEAGSEKDSIFNKVKNILKLILRVLESFADWLIEKCNGISRNYRLVARKLEKEMKTEKEKIQAEKQSLAVAERTIDVDSSGAEDGGIEDDGQPSSDTVDLLEVKVQPGKRIQKPPSEISLAEPQEDKTKFESSKPKIYLLLEACFYVIISRSELVCYFLMVLDQILQCQSPVSTLTPDGILVGYVVGT
ncbi:hypothetical protein KUTeg_018939 [Tegillarca granosa]|uniref:Piezo TM25-28 domain-containing protein n=1 Tax=Tegillarca granosa TaxID=220873 RepID=A0ABQ9EB32_TEGGR|nr:hypothetical protein KUTeg_018939 [Tegillarca granosa]